MGSEDVGRMLLVFGLVVAGLGALFLVAGHVPWLGRLPGDIRIEHDNVRIYIPLAASLLLSVLMTILLNLLTRR